jgi:hypothetical protein
MSPEKITITAILLFTVKELFVLINNLVQYMRNGKKMRMERPEEFCIFDVKDRYEIIEALREMKGRRCPYLGDDNP